MQQQDGLPVGDASVAGHGEGLGEGQFEDFDVLAVLLQSAAGAGPVGRCVGGGEEVEAFGDGAGAHVGVEDVGERPEGDAELLGALASDGGGRVVRVQQARGGLDEHAVGVVVDVGRVAELAGEQDAAASGVVGQDDGAVAPVVGLALLGLPASVAAAVVEGGAPQDVPALGGEFDVADPDAGVAVQAPPGPVEAGAAAVVGGVGAGAAGHLVSCGVRWGISVTSW